MLDLSALGNPSLALERSYEPLIVASRELKRARRLTITHSHYLCTRESPVRIGAEPNSEQVSTLHPGDTIGVIEERVHGGVVQVRCAKGWVSEKTVHGSETHA